MQSNQMKVKTRAGSLILITLAVVGVIVGLGFSLFQFAGIITPSTSTVIKPTPLGSAFYPYWQPKFPKANLVDFYTANGIDHRSNDINPATGQPYIQMTKYTANIGTIAASIVTGTTKHETVHNILNWLQSNLNQPGNSNCTNVESLLRTADTILTNRCAVGCSDWDAAFIALARAKGISASLVNTVSNRWIQTSIAAGCSHIPLRGHHVAEVHTGSTNGGWELVDPTLGIFTSYDSSGNALMRFDGYTANHRPLQPLGNGYVYRVFRRGIDSWDTGILNLQIQKSLINTQYGVSNNTCTHDNDFYSDPSNCNPNDILIGTMKDPWVGTLKLCKKSPYDIHLQAGLNNCPSGQTLAGTYVDSSNANQSLCYSDPNININYVLDSSECSLAYNQIGVLKGANARIYKLCFRYTGDDFYSIPTVLKLNCSGDDVQVGILKGDGNQDLILCRKKSYNIRLRAGINNCPLGQTLAGTYKDQNNNNQSLCYSDPNISINYASNAANCMQGYRQIGAFLGVNGIYYKLCFR